MHRRSQQGGEKNWEGGKFTGESCKCTPCRARVHFKEIGEIWTVGVVNLVVLAVF